MVRAKFNVQRIERQTTSTPKRNPDGSLFKDANNNYVYEPGEMQTIVLSPVYGNSDPNHENTKFWAASPSGEIRLGCVNLQAAQYFELNKEYYIDFRKADGTE